MKAREVTDRMAKEDPVGLLKQLRCGMDDEVLVVKALMVKDHLTATHICAIIVDAETEVPFGYLKAKVDAFSIEKILQHPKAPEVVKDALRKPLPPGMVWVHVVTPSLSALWEETPEHSLADDASVDEFETLARMNPDQSEKRTLH
jgi:hypothetical protein